jgi:hypothetical protein
VDAPDAIRGPIADVGLTALIHAIHRRSGGTCGALTIQAEPAYDYQRGEPGRSAWRG